MTDGTLLPPRAPAISGATDAALRALTRRFRVAVRLTVLVLVAALGDRIPGVPLAYIAPPRFWIWFQLVLSIPIVLWSGAPLYRHAWRSTTRGRPDRFLSISLAVAGVWIYSVIAVLRPGFFGEPYRDESGLVRVYFEVATVIVTLTLVDWLVEARSLARPAAAIGALLKLVPKTTRRLRPDGLEEDAPVDAVRPGDAVRVWPLETVPLDGVVIEGSGAVDESKIGGEATPVEKKPGDRVFGGASNCGGALVVRVEAAAGDQLLTRYARLLTDALRSRAPIERLVDRWAGWLVPAAVVIAVATFAAWTNLGPEPRLALATLSAAAVLVVASSSALGLATSMPMAEAVARGAKEGILFSSRSAVERLRDADTLVLAAVPPVGAGDVATLRALKAAGLRLVLWTSKGFASVAAEVGVEEAPVPASLDRKVAAVKELQSEGRRVAMVGNDADDAPGLAQSVVCIAMGTGSGVAIESADITLVKGDLRGILRARRLSQATLRNVKQNLFFAFIYNALGVPIAAGVLYPYFGILLDPMIAAAAMSLSSVSVIVNALRLRLARI
ncbi:MAG TPA: hypothetical protein VHR17_12025 [Thermoanaerobaculia bacterium]|nr:hypothetical protein [Thermoanaerobaculia bacterium]